MTGRSGKQKRTERNVLPYRPPVRVTCSTLRWQRRYCAAPVFRGSTATPACTCPPVAP
jgi:hypothetical protein